MEFFNNFNSKYAFHPIDLKKEKYHNKIISYYNFKKYQNLIKIGINFLTENY